MSKELQKMLSHMRDNSEKKIRYIDNMINSKDVECFKYIPLLDNHFLYQVFREDVKNNLDSCYWMLSSLHHAFIDDGDFWVGAKIYSTEFIGKTNYHYDYYIKGGDNWDCRSVTDQQLCNLFEKQLEYQAYYEEYKGVLTDQSYTNCLLDVKMTKSGYGSGKEYPEGVLKIFKVAENLRDKVDDYLKCMYESQWFGEIPKPEEYFGKED